MTVKVKQPLSSVPNGSFVIDAGDTSQTIYQVLVPDSGIAVTGGAAGSVPCARQPDGLLRPLGGTTQVIVVVPVWTA